MKQLLSFLPFLALLCTSCINENDYINQGDENQITFNTVSESFVKNKKKANEQQDKQTKGTPTYTVAEMPNMSVSSYYTQASTWSSVSTTASPNRMNNLLWTQANGSWSTAPAVLWNSADDANDNYSFFSYAPMANATNGISFTNKNGTPNIQYTVPTTITNQPDITVATALNQHPSNGRVNLLHKHALTAIAIKIYGQGEKISNIRLKYISTQGTLSQDNSNGIVWSGLNTISSNTSEYNFGLTSASPIASTTTPTSIVANNGYLMMIPQALTEDALMIVTIDGNDVAFGLYNQDIQNWEAGTIITYTLNTFAQTSTVNYTAKELSNCYIINPSSTDNLIIRIPIKRVLDSPAYTNIANWRAGVIRQSTSKLFDTSIGVRFTGTGAYDNGISTKGTGYTDSYFELYVPRGLAKRGYFTVTLGANSTTAPNIRNRVDYNGQPYYWNWTFWITDYNPYGTRTPIEYNSDGTVWTWSVPGGKLFNVNGTVTMDRNICASNETNPGATYQYGRKDPFDSFTSLVQYNDVGTIMRPYAGQFQYTIAETILYQNESIWTTLDYSSTFSWNSEGQAEMETSTLWKYSASNKKTLYDPSPMGFRVAPSSFYTQLGAYNKQVDMLYSCLTFRPKIGLTNNIKFRAAGAKGTGSSSATSGYNTMVDYWADDTFMYRYNLNGTTTFIPVKVETMHLCPIRCVAIP